MACTIYIADDAGALTVYLTQTAADLAEYVPQADPDNPWLTEQIHVSLLGTQSTIRGNVASLNKLFDQARHWYKYHFGPHIFIYFQPDSGDSAAYRAELRNGHIEYTATTMGPDWVSGIMDATIFIERVSYWEASAVTQVTMTANGSTATTVTLYNTNDGATHGYCSAAIASNAVAGELPAPAIITLTHDASANPVYGYIVANGVYNVSFAPSDTFHNDEAEAGSGTPGSDVAQALASGGHYRNYTGLTGTTQLRGWAITLALGDAGLYHIIAKGYTAVPTNGLWLYYAIADAFAYVAYGQKVAARARWLQDLGLAQLPPGLLQMTPKVFSIFYYGYLASGSYALDLDNLLIIPADAYRRYVAIDDTIDNTLPLHTIGASEALVDNPYQPGVYSIRSGFVNVADFVPIGSPVMLYPGKAQRIYVLCDGIPTISHTLTVGYRARRSQI